MNRQDILNLEIKGQKAILEAANKRKKKKKVFFLWRWLNFFTKFFQIK
jgi:hypothetical protein